MMPSDTCEPLLGSWGGSARPGLQTESTLIVTGNPNVGKSVIFGLLSGRYAAVSNYPGTTVAVTRRIGQIDGRAIQVCDTPGLNSLLAGSEDELVARELLLEGRGATVLQVADAKNLLRALLLTLELAELGVPLVLDLNMIDEARERRITLDAWALAEILQVPVVPTIGTQRWGLERLRRAIPRASPPDRLVQYPGFVSQAIGQMETLLPADLPARRARALLWLAGDRALQDALSRLLPAQTVERLHAIAAQAQEQSANRLATVMARARLRAAQAIAERVMTRAPQAPSARLRRLGDLSMHRVWGWPILLGVLGLMYVLVGDVAAQRGVGVLEEVVFGRYLSPWFQAAAGVLVPWQGLRAMLVGEYGLLTMALPYAFAIILPIVGMFFFCFGILEDTGYLPRLAVMANRGCRLLGLNGRAVLPLILGLGCDTMATMATRILETRRDRILVTLLLTLGVPCSAQLGVILAMLASRPPAALAIWLGLLLGVVLLVGWAASRVVPGERTPFLYEIPPLRWPQLSNVAVKTLGRLEWYVKEAVPLFFLGTLALFLADATGILQRMERVGTPLVVGWLGLPARATGALLLGFLRRDFGAAGFFAMQQAGQLTGVQVLVSATTLTLFVPCIAQLFMMVKERGWKLAIAMAAFVFAVAFLVGGLLHRILSLWPLLV